MLAPPRYVSVMVTKADGDATALLFIEGDAGPDEESEAARVVLRSRTGGARCTSWQAAIRRLIREQQPFLMQCLHG